MTKRIAFAVIAISALSSFAHAGQPIMPMPDGKQWAMMGTTLAPTFTTMLPTMASEATSEGLKKEVIAAQDDITHFVASNGKIRTAQFVHAIGQVREVSNLDQESVSDMELAQALLAELQ